MFIRPRQSIRILGENYPLLFFISEPGNKTYRIAISIPREEGQLPGLTTHTQALSSLASDPTNW